MDDSYVLRFFGRRLRLARRRASLSQEDLGQRSGVRQDTISHYETGQCRPDLTTLWRLASILHVEIGYFFPEDRFLTLEADDRETLALLGSLLFLLLQRGAATAVTRRLSLVPPCTALMAWLLFGESLSLSVLIGLALTAVGVAVVVRATRRDA